MDGWMDGERDKWEICIVSATAAPSCLRVSSYLRHRQSCAPTRRWRGSGPSAVAVAAAFAASVAAAAAAAALRALGGRPALERPRRERERGSEAASARVPGQEEGRAKRRKWSRKRKPTETRGAGSIHSLGLKPCLYLGADRQPRAAEARPAGATRVLALLLRAVARSD